MKLKTRVLMYAVTLILALSCSQPAFAVSTFTVLSSGNGDFELQGEALESVAALDITITYDTVTLSNPKVTAGSFLSGALTAVNTNVAGSVRIGIITTSALQGSGILAKLDFDQVGNSPGRIIAVKASIANSSGTPLPVLAMFVNPSSDSAVVETTSADKGTQSNTSASSASAPAPTSGTASSAGQQVVIVGLVPSGESAGTKIAEPPAAPDALPEPVKEPVKEIEMVPQRTATSAPDVEKPVTPISQDKKIYTQKSVLELFREYKGERSMKAFMALFDRDPLIGFTQTPAIGLSDGKATVKISFIAIPSGKSAPAIKVKDATVISLKKDTDNTNTWIAELRPDMKDLSAVLIVPQEKTNMEFPIIASPKIAVDLDKSGKVTEADFKLFLSDRGTVKKPKFDLNGDGKRDFVDDYIFTANYIVKKPARNK